MAHKPIKEISLTRKLHFGISLIVFNIIFGTTGLAIAQNNAQNASAIATKLPSQLTDTNKAALKGAVNSPSRVDKARDVYRHPYETIEFFGIKPSDTVIEIWPGQGWYSSILSDYLRQGNGHLIAAHFDTENSSSPLVRQVVNIYQARFGSSTNSNVSIVPFGPRSAALGPPNSVDYVLTFRNIHNWINQGWTEKAFSDFYAVIKPGGYLGIEEHRGNDSDPQDPLAEDGYVRQDFVIEMAIEAGFELVGTSEINANPRDTKNYPFGVWTLPPVLRTAPAGQPENVGFDTRPYRAIGESDRMTLLFRKPVAMTPTINASNATTNGPRPVPVVFGPPPTPKRNTLAAANPVTTTNPRPANNQESQPVNNARPAPISTPTNTIAQNPQIANTNNNVPNSVANVISPPVIVSPPPPPTPTPPPPTVITAPTPEAPAIIDEPILASETPVSGANNDIPNFSLPSTNPTAVITAPTNTAVTNTSGQATSANTTTSATRPTTSRPPATTSTTTNNAATSANNRRPANSAATTQRTQPTSNNQSNNNTQANRNNNSQPAQASTSRTNNNRTSAANSNNNRTSTSNNNNQSIRANNTRTSTSSSSSRNNNSATNPSTNNRQASTSSRNNTTRPSTPSNRTTAATTRPTTQPKAKAKAAPATARPSNPNIPDWNPPPKKKKN